MVHTETKSQDPLAAFIEDYNAAAKIHVPNWRGGTNRKVAAELIRMGWRKSPEPN